MSAGPLSATGEERARAPPRLTLFERWAWNAFGRPSPKAESDPRLAEELLRGRWRVTPEEFRASTIGATLAVAVGLVAVAVTADLLLPGSLGLGLKLLFGVTLTVGGTAGFYVAFSMLPSSRAGDRGRAIDRSIGPAMNFVAALSCADVPIDTIFRDLSAQELYGAVATEAAWVVRDCDALGMDVLSALRKEARHSASSRFREFLQGAVTTAESGGELRSYFLAQAERFEREEEVLAQGQLERLGIFAEAYVAVAVAFPLFLLVLLSVFTLIEGSATGLLLLVWVTALVVIPAAELGFAALFRMYREVV